MTQTTVATKAILRQRICRMRQWGYDWREIARITKTPTMTAWRLANPHKVKRWGKA